jgi:GAF domain-containing protein
VVQLGSTAPRHYTTQDVEPLRQFGAWWAVALENARLCDRAASLFELANTVSTTMELKAVGNVIAEQVAKAMAVKGSSIRTLDRKDRRLDLIGSYGLSRAYLTDKGPVIAGENLTDVLEGKPAIIRDVTTDRRTQYPEAATAEGIASMATVPMVVKGVITGVLRVYTEEPYDFDQEEVAFLTAAAGVAGAAVENARIYSGIQEDFDVLVNEIVFMRRAARAVSRGKDAS